MKTRSLKYVSSKYRYVSGRLKNSTDMEWFVNITGISRSSFLNEKDAAIAVDKILISKGKQPVNILKKK